MSTDYRGLERLGKRAESCLKAPKARDEKILRPGRDARLGDPLLANGPGSGQIMRSSTEGAGIAVS